MGWFLLFPFFIIVLIFGAAIANQSAMKRKQNEYWASLPPPRERLPESLSCSRCRGSMERGYILDRTHGGIGMGTWQEGSPSLSSVTSMVSRLRIERSIPIVSFRCVGCGHLECFARPDLLNQGPDGTVKPSSFGEL